MDDRQRQVARVYARSILELAEARGDTEALLEEFEAFSGLVESSPELQDFLASPLVASDARAKLLEDRLRGHASDLLVDALQVMNRNSRLGSVSAVAVAFREELDRARGRVDVTVRTAAPLEDEQRNELVAAIEKMTGRTPSLRHAVDAGLIGGMVLQIEDERIDASVANQLRRVGEGLKMRASKEIHEDKSYWA